MKTELYELMRRQRQYASYFHFAGDPAGTEADVVRDWVRARLDDDQSCFVGIEHRSNPKDPPDVVLIDRCGRRHGFEVTEFVDGTTIASYANRRPTGIRNYTEEEFQSLVSKRIQEKASKEFKDGTCVTKRLLIYSDEPLIRSGDGLKFLSRFPAVRQSRFDEVWFMLPPAVPMEEASSSASKCRIYQIQCG